MKTMKNMRIFAVIPLLFALLLPFAACAKEKRFDYSELNLRLTALMPAAAIDESALFYADGIYYYYYTLASEHDTLLTMKEDASGRLERVTLTADETALNTAFDSFRTLSLALAEVFIPEADTEALRAGVSFDDMEYLSAHTLCTYTQGFYKASLFLTSQTVCFMLLYE